MSLILEIVTPEKRAYSDTITSVVLPSQDGEIEILDGHIPLISVINAGEIKITKPSGMEYLAVDKGFMQLLGSKISLITEGAIDIKDIDLNEVTEARKRAEEALKEVKKGGAEDFALMEKLEAQVRFSLAKELTKKRH